MKTYIERIESELGKGWAVVDLGTEDREYVEFSTKARAKQFRQLMGVLVGETIQERYDDYINGLIRIYEQMGLDGFAAVSEKHA